MNFEVLEKFEWYNDPENVRFDIDAMTVYAKSDTDFWQSVHRGYKKDNGHFFFCRQNGDFQLTLKWKIEDLKELAQCGVMVRIDERNWFKASIEKETSDDFSVISSFTTLGHSDLAKSIINGYNNEIWFRIVRVGDEFEVFFSVDGIAFVKFRMFYIKAFEDVKVGAYISSIQEDDFFAMLSDINIEEPF